MDYQDAHVGDCKKSYVFVVFSFLLNPMPTPMIYLESGVVPILVVPRNFKMHMLATSRNPLSCSNLEFLHAHVLRNAYVVDVEKSYVLSYSAVGYALGKPA